MLRLTMRLGCLLFDASDKVQWRYLVCLPCPQHTRLCNTRHNLGCHSIDVVAVASLRLVVHNRVCWEPGKRTSATNVVMFR